MFVIQSSDLSHFLGCDLEQNQTGVKTKGKGPHNLEYSYDIIRICSLMIYSEFVENNIVVDTKTSLLRCIPFISELKRRYNFYRTVNELSVFTNSQLKKLLKFFFHSIKIELGDSPGKSFTLYP